VNFDGLDRVLDEAVGRGAFPGAVVLVSRAGETVYHKAFGSRSLIPEQSPMSTSIVFDLSSLTKPLATTTALMLLLREGRLRLDDRVTRFLPNFGVNGKSAMTLRDLLAHCAGFGAHRTFFRDVARAEQSGRSNFMASHGAKDWVYEQIGRERVEYQAVTKSVYSDLGFIVLGQIIELLSQTSLDRYCQERIFRPLGLRSTAFIDLAQLRLRKLSPVSTMIAPTEKCPWRGRVLCGEVHDDNCYAMGGVAGHAGLFSTAADVDVMANVLHACYRDEDDFVPATLLRAFWTRDGRVTGSTWGLGWDTPSTAGYSSAGSRMSRDAVGHLGFTGTSIWIDPSRHAHIIFLTNRVHPTRNNEQIRDVRPRVHDAALEALDG
jgi:serine-type D-Ala-D-Ala carboxypeptidase